MVAHSALPVTPNSMEQFFVDLAAGTISSFLQFVFAMSFAAGCFATERTLPSFPVGVMMTGISAILTQIFYCGISDIPFLFVSPDAFYIPLINNIGLHLSSRIPDDEIFRHTFIFSIVLCTVVVGISKSVVGYFQIIQFTDYIPYPAICGLMAGIGINLIQIAFVLSSPMASTSMFFDVNIIPAFIFAILSITSHYLHFSQSKSFLVLLLISFILFYSFKFYFNIPNRILESENWTFSAHSALNSIWVYWLNEKKTFLHKIDFHAVSSCTSQFISISLLMVLKISLTIPAYEKILKTRFNKSMELFKYGLGTVVAGLCGGTGTSPSISILTIVVEMGGGPRVPMFIAPLVFACLYVTHFSVVSYAPKFVFAGLLLASGYHMTMTWLYVPLQRLPRGESVILLVIIAVYLGSGMLRAMAMGSVLSVILFSYKFHEAGCVKFVSSGTVFHSTCNRSDVDSKFLQSVRHRVRIVQLQGYIAFANASQMYDVISELFEDEADADGQPCTSSKSDSHLHHLSFRDLWSSFSVKKKPFRFPGCATSNEEDSNSRLIPPTNRYGDNGEAPGVGPRNGDVHKAGGIGAASGTYNRTVASPPPSASISCAVEAPSSPPPNLFSSSSDYDRSAYGFMHGVHSLHTSEVERATRQIIVRRNSTAAIGASVTVRRTSSGYGSGDLVRGAGEEDIELAGRSVGRSVFVQDRTGAGKGGGRRGKGGRLAVSIHSSYRGVTSASDLPVHGDESPALRSRPGDDLEEHGLGTDGGSGKPRVTVSGMYSRHAASGRASLGRIGGALRGVRPALTSPSGKAGKVKGSRAGAGEGSPGSSGPTQTAADEFGVLSESSFLDEGVEGEDGGGWTGTWMGSDVDAEHAEFIRESAPCALVLHMNSVMGSDASAMDIFSQIITLCKEKKCRLIFASMSRNEKQLFDRAGILTASHVTVEADLDDALTAVEDMLLGWRERVRAKRCDTPEGGGERSGRAAGRDGTTSSDSRPARCGETETALQPNMN